MVISKVELFLLVFFAWIMFNMSRMYNHKSDGFLKSQFSVILTFNGNWSSMDNFSFLTLTGLV